MPMSQAEVAARIDGLDSADLLALAMAALEQLSKQQPEAQPAAAAAPASAPAAAQPVYAGAAQPVYAGAAVAQPVRCGTRRQVGSRQCNDGDSWLHSPAYWAVGSSTTAMFKLKFKFNKNEHSWLTAVPPVGSLVAGIGRFVVVVTTLMSPLSCHHSLVTTLSISC